MTYQDVVVGTDGSVTAQDAVRHAGELAAATGARLVVVSAYSPHDHRPPDVSADDVPEDLRWLLTEQAQAESVAEEGRHAARSAGAGTVVVRAVAGDAADVLLETAEEFDAGAIVVGSVGLTRPARFILGSVASTVAHHAPCDVLIVHTAS